MDLCCGVFGLFIVVCFRGCFGVLCCFVVVIVWVICDIIGLFLHLKVFFFQMV